MDNNEKNNINQDDDKEKKEIKIITGDGSDLNISPVQEHIPYEDSIPSSNHKKHNIVIPKGSSDNKNQ